MEKLNLPDFEHKIRKYQDRVEIFDPIRKKFVMLSPEEWVRQNMIRFLIEYHQYPKTLIQVENQTHYHQLQKRTDILIYDREGNPFLIVECKKTGFKLNQACFDQVAAYNHTLKAPFIMLTNGNSHFCCQVDHRTNKIHFIDKIPEYQMQSS